MSVLLLRTICFNLARHRNRSKVVLLFISFYLLVRAYCIRQRRRRRSILRETIKIKDAPLITFTGAGQLAFYYQGICAYLNDHFYLDNVRFSGISAGSTAAASLAGRLPPEASMIFALRWFKLVADRRLKLFLMNPESMLQIGVDLCSEFGIDDEYVVSTCKRVDLYYGVTNCSVWPPRHELLSGFQNRYESFYAMSCSMRILPFFRFFGYFRKMLLLDGGFSALYSIPDDVMESKIIRISACSRIEADIQPQAGSPHCFTILDVFKMPSLEFIEQQFERGYLDAMRSKNKLIRKGLKLKYIGNGLESRNKLEYWMQMLRRHGNHIFHEKNGLERKDYSHLIPQISPEPEMKCAH